MEIFNIGIGEFLLIAVIALLVFGPERLPEVLRQGARFFSQVRGVGDEIQRQLLAETQPIRETLEQTKREIEATARPISDLQKEIDETQQQLRDASRILPDRIYPPPPPDEPVRPAAPRAASVDPDDSPSPVTPAPPTEPAPRAAAEPPSEPPVEVRGYKPVSRSEEADGYDAG